MSYRYVTVPDRATLMKLDYQQLLSLVLSTKDADGYNMRLYTLKMFHLHEAMEHLAGALGKDHPIFEKLVRLEDEIPRPPTQPTTDELMHQLRTALAEPPKTERESILQELKTLGLKVERTNKSAKELKRILERHYFKRIVRPLIGEGKCFAIFDRTACRSSCPGWDGVSATCECGRTKLRWRLGPNHSVDAPQLLAVRIGVDDSV